jgi:peptide/nickel transport system substrate-binding protein
MVQQPAPWLLQLLSQVWAGALDMEWMIEQGDWDGTCDTWTEFHSPAAEESLLFTQANGTGPYKLGNWKKGEELTLEGNENYWRTEPIWDGGPSGPPALTYVVLQFIDEWGTRFAKLSAGEADTVVVPRAEISQVDPMVKTVYYGNDASAESEIMNEDGWLQLYRDFPTVAMTAAMFNFDINPESEFIGTAQLDGDGIPIDFFDDIHVRQGFNYCFDWETFIAEALQGEGHQARGPIIEGLQGFSQDSDIYAFDLDKCSEELALAWDGQLPETGFKMTLAYNEGNDTRKMASEILAEGLALASENYQADVISLEWPSFLDARRAESLPISVSGWLEDYHDASNWVHPFMHSKGAYARAQGFPEEMQTVYDDLIDQGVAETDEAARDEIYAQLQQLAYDDAINIFLHQALGRSYMNGELQGWYSNPLAPTTWYYPLSKAPMQ